jgi:ATP/maltotriose-dependent transcriptional regulator MalT
VSAPAGFGKTTLLAEWLGGTPGEDRSVAWLSLDPADNEPAAFWKYVVTALQTAVPASARVRWNSSRPPRVDRACAHHGGAE